MNEYIEKAAILSKCEEMWNNADETTQTGVDTINTLDRITDYIESLPAADVQLVDRWISVDEALPENGNEVFVWYEYFRYGKYNCMYQTYGIGSYIQQYDMWSGDDLNGTKVRVLYWQPLPEPPSKQTE